MNISSLQAQVIKLMQAELDKARVEVSMYLDDSLSIFGDPILLEQVLINIITNAVHALEQVSSPQLKMICFLNDEKSIVIQISDNGCGIDEDKLDMIFVPFFSTKDKGSGIGLSLCQQIINLHGGFIEVEATKGGGTRFKLIFLS